MVRWVIARSTFLVGFILATIVSATEVATIQLGGCELSDNGVGKIDSSCCVSDSCSNTRDSIIATLQEEVAALKSTVSLLVSMVVSPPPASPPSSPPLSPPLPPPPSSPPSPPPGCSNPLDPAGPNIQLGESTQAICPAGCHGSTCTKLLGGLTASEVEQCASHGDILGSPYYPEHPKAQKYKLFEGFECTGSQPWGGKYYNALTIAAAMASCDEHNGVHGEYNCACVHFNPSQDRWMIAFGGGVRSASTGWYAFERYTGDAPVSKYIDPCTDMPLWAFNSVYGHRHALNNYGGRSGGCFKDGEIKKSALGNKYTRMTSYACSGEQLATVNLAAGTFEYLTGHCGYSGSCIESVQGLIAAKARCLANEACVGIQGQCNGDCADASDYEQYSFCLNNGVAHDLSCAGNDQMWTKQYKSVARILNECDERTGCQCVTMDTSAQTVKLFGSVEVASASDKIALFRSSGEATDPTYQMGHITGPASCSESGVTLEGNKCGKCGVDPES